MGSLHVSGRLHIVGVRNQVREAWRWSGRHGRGGKSWRRGVSGWPRLMPGDLPNPKHPLPFSFLYTGCRLLREAS